MSIAQFTLLVFVFNMLLLTIRSVYLLRVPSDYWGVGLVCLAGTFAHGLYWATDIPSLWIRSMTEVWGIFWFVYLIVNFPRLFEGS